jgi:hypothetical protein
MARKVFFSFHYERDAWRAANVRNSDLIPDQDEYGVIDKAEWESIEREGDQAIKNWIQAQLKNTTCTIVLIGAETASRDWVLYEIQESWKRGNAVVGLRIHNIKNQHQQADTAGVNPLDLVKLEGGRALSSVCKTYDWVLDQGRENLGDWVESACIALEEMQAVPLLEKMDAVRPALATSVAGGPTIIRNPPRPWCR